MLICECLLNLACSKNAWTLRRSTPASRKKHRGKPKNWRKFGPCLWLQNQRSVSEAHSLWWMTGVTIACSYSQLCNSGKSAIDLKYFSCLLGSCNLKRAAPECVVELSFKPSWVGVCMRLWDTQDFKEMYCLLWKRIKDSWFLLFTALYSLSFLSVTLILSSSVPFIQCVLWLLSGVPVSWESHCLCNQGLSLESCQGCNLFAHFALS